jgi:hypothetical protein
LRVAELLEHDLLQRPEDSLGLGPRDLGAISDGDRELCLGRVRRLMGQPIAGAVNTPDGSLNGKERHRRPVAALSGGTLKHAPSLHETTDGVH